MLSLSDVDVDVDALHNSVSVRMLTNMQVRTFWSKLASASSGERRRRTVRWRWGLGAKVLISSSNIYFEKDTDKDEGLWNEQYMQNIHTYTHIEPNQVIVDYWNIITTITLCNEYICI